MEATAVVILKEVEGECDEDDDDDTEVERVEEKGSVVPKEVEGECDEDDEDDTEVERVEEKGSVMPKEVEGECDEDDDEDTEVERVEEKGSADLVVGSTSVRTVVVESHTTRPTMLGAPENHTLKGQICTVPKAVASMDTAPASHNLGNTTELLVEGADMPMSTRMPTFSAGSSCGNEAVCSEGFELHNR